MEENKDLKWRELINDLHYVCYNDLEDDKAEYFLQITKKIEEFIPCKEIKTEEELAKLHGEFWQKFCLVINEKFQNEIWKWIEDKFVKKESVTMLEIGKNKEQRK